MAPGSPDGSTTPARGSTGTPACPPQKKPPARRPLRCQPVLGPLIPPKKTTRRPPTAPAPGASRQLCPPLPLLLGYLQMKLGSRPGPQRLPHPKSPPHQPASFPICSPAAPSAPQGSPDRVAGRLSRGSGRIGFRGGGRAHMLRDHRRGSPAPPAGPGAGSPPITLPKPWLGSSGDPGGRGGRRGRWDGGSGEGNGGDFVCFLLLFSPFPSSLPTPGTLQKTERGTARGRSTF